MVAELRKVGPFDWDALPYLNTFGRSHIGFGKSFIPTIGRSCKSEIHVQKHDDSSYLT